MLPFNVAALQPCGLQAALEVLLRLTLLKTRCDTVTKAALPLLLSRTDVRL
jgi:hypothetical protein